MLIILLAYLGGVLTILSPCILPVLPFVFARADRSFARGALPLLAGMALTFAVVATLAAVGGGWAVRANAIGRWAALALLAAFGLSLVIPAISDRLSRPIVAFGSRLSERASGREQESITSSLVLGIATGLLWAPCAGPILGIIFTTAAIRGASFDTTLLLLAYALGAATSLALALAAGGTLFSKLKKSLGASERIRKLLGVLVLVGVAAIAAGVDTRVLASLSGAQTNALETGLARRLGIKGFAETGAGAGKAGRLELPVEGALPPLDELGPWINSGAISREQLKGKVVLIDFWTYSCINCLRSLPYVRAWHDAYARDGLVIIGIHAPEFAFERNPDNVRKAVRDLQIRYPVAIDNSYSAWKALGNPYWPAHYFFDAQGRQRFHHFGEGHYEQSEMVIRQLLAEAGRAPKSRLSEADANGTGAAAAIATIQSPETYIGYGRAERFVSPGGQAHDVAKIYSPATLQRNDWALEGKWTISRQSARLNDRGGAISYRFHARDLHLVLGASHPVRFRLTIDGQEPDADAGIDVTASGTGTIEGEGLYQLVRQKGPVRDRTMRIEFLDPGVDAFSFTFG